MIVREKCWNNRSAQGRPNMDTSLVLHFESSAVVNLSACLFVCFKGT